jgi:hypothetical protein
MERPEREVRSVGARCRDMGSLQNKAPLGSGESTGPASNGVRLGDCNVAQ